MWDYLPEVIKGLHTSLTLTLAATFIALLLALLFTVLLTLKVPVVSQVIKVYITWHAVTGADFFDLLWAGAICRHS